MHAVALPARLAAYIAMSARFSMSTALVPGSAGCRVAMTGKVNVANALVAAECDLVEDGVGLCGEFFGHGAQS